MLTLKGDVHPVTCDRTAKHGQFYTVEIPALASQPFFWREPGRFPKVARAASLRAVLGSDSQLEARVTVNGLIARENGQFASGRQT